MRTLRRVVNVYGRRCWYCPRLATTVDHFRPLSRGGGWVLENLRPACGSCNAAKADMLPGEWARPRLRERPWEGNR